MRRISSISAIAGVIVLLLTSAAPDFSHRVLMRVGGSTATIADYKLLIGSSVYPSDTALALLANHLRKLEDARLTLGYEITEDSFALGKFMEWSQALQNISALRVANRVETDSAERQRFFTAHPELFHWREPHFIGSVILTVEPQVAKSLADSLRSKQTISTSPKRYRVINYNVARGLNPYVDYAAFRLAAAFPQSEPWRDAAVISGEIAASPSSPDHVAELLTTLLYDSLYNRWIDSLGRVLPTEIDTKSLDFLKNSL